MPTSYRQMRDSELEVARIAAGRLIDGNLKLAKPYGAVETTAKHKLKWPHASYASVGQPDSRVNKFWRYLEAESNTL